MKISDASLWESFACVAKEKNFTRAAASMRVGVPLLSKRIAALEESLGVRLFQRSTRKVSLTDEGKSLLPHVAAVLEDFRGLENKFERKDKLTGTIRITTATVTAGRLLSPVVVEFMQLHPEVQVEIDVSDHIIDMIDSQMDLAIRIDQPEAGSLIYRKLAVNDLTLVASPEYLKRNKAPLKTPKDLRNHSVMILPFLGDCGFQDGSFKLKDFAESERIRTASASVITELTLNGGGIAARAVWDVYPFLKSGQLVEVLKKHPLENFGEIYAVIPSRRFLAHRVRVFIDFLAEKAQDWEFHRHFERR